MLPRSLADIVDQDLDLAGPWRGVFGPHGEEVVRIDQDGDDLVAVKLTGDPHVPAGEVTFRARLRGWGGEGEGQIADRGHQNPRFVPGFFAVLGRNRVSFEWFGFGKVVFRRVGS